MTEDKVYTPTEIKDVAFPILDLSTQSSSNPSGGVLTPTVTTDTPLPIKKIASEVIGQALNTSARKILGEFEFTPSGAIRIGQYLSGSTGEVNISPAGIVAKNVNGDVTFSLDGTTGDATFKGTLTSGSIITGATQTGQVTLNPGADIILVSGNSTSAELIFEKESNPAEQVKIGFAYGAGAPYEFYIDPTNAAQDVTLFLGYGKQFNGIGLNVKTGTRVDLNGNTKVTGNLEVTGSLTKGSGSFDIPHPDKSKPKGTRLRHYFVESPTSGDNIYRFKVKVENGTATVQLPDYFKHLNASPQAWISPVDVLGVASAKVNLTRVEIKATVDGTYNLLVIGTRKDPIAKKYWNKYKVEYQESK
jgi:hypothetical protein